MSLSMPWICSALLVLLTAQDRSGDAREWKAQGMATAARGDLQGAVEPLGKACALAPRDEDACYFFARNLYALGRYDLARDPFEKALKAAPRSMRSRVHRAVALNFEALGLAADAERHFLQAIRLNRGGGRPSEDPRIDYGAFLFRQGRTEESIEPLERAARDLPSCARAHTELGRALLQLDKPEAAARPLERALELEPANWDARLLLGAAFLRLGRTREGEEQMRIGREGWARQTYGSSTVR